MTLTATQLITERKEGVIDRTWVAGELVVITWCHMMLYIAGVTATEIILAQTISFFFMALAQSIPLFFFVTYVFDVSVE